MNRPLYLATLAFVFGATAWATRAWSLSHELETGTLGDRAGAPMMGTPLDAAPATVPEPSAAEPDGPPPGDLDDGVDAPAPKPAGEPGEPVAITFEDLSQWDLDPRDVQVPEEIQAYGGRTIDIVGYMIPYGNPEKVEEFILVNDLGSCCFGQAPLPHHLIECTMKSGTSTVYRPGPVRVRGTFRVEEHRQGKYLVSVYAMDVDACDEVR